MTTINESNICSICVAPMAEYLCIGCGKYFCSTDLQEHQQQLTIKFDNEIVKSHEELIEQIQNLDQSNHVLTDLTDRIEQWRKLTTQKVENAAAKAQYELRELINKGRQPIIQQLEPTTKEVDYYRREKTFHDNDIDRLKQQINDTKQKLEQFVRNNTKKVVVIDNDHIDWNEIICVQEQQNFIQPIPADTQWSQKGVVVAHGLDRPGGVFIDDDNKTILVTDFYNHRVMQWKIGRKDGVVVAGGHDRGSQPHQLNYPTDVLIDKETDSLIISNWGMEQVVRWSRSNGTFEGEILIDKIQCWGLAMDDQRYLYVSDVENNQVKRYQLGGDMKHGVTVAGGNGRGSSLDQLNDPKRIFVDQHQTVYVSDHENHRVVKWTRGATEGIVVAGGLGLGKALTQLNRPEGLFVDASSTVYVADGLNHRIMRWSQGAEQGNVIVDGCYEKTGSYELRMLSGMCCDRHGNLYVVDSANNLVRRFTII